MHDPFVVYTTTEKMAKHYKMMNISIVFVLKVCEAHCLSFLPTILPIIQEKDKEKSREKDREAREKEKKAVNGHLFSSVSLGHAAFCQHCNKTLNVKDAVSCTGKRVPLYMLL